MHRTLGLCLFSAIACLTVSLAQAQPVGPSRPQITAGVDEANLVTLSGNTRPEATAANDRGAVSDKLPLDHIQLLLHRPALQEQALEQTIDALHNPASSSFHKWLTAAQFGQQFGVASKDVSTITSWLSSQGFKVNLVSTSRMVIDFSGTAGQVRDAFHTEIHNLNVNGQTHIANMSDPKIPAALAPAITGIVALHNFLPHTNYTPIGVNPKLTGTCGSYGPCLALVPADLQTIYDYAPVYTEGYTGAGVTVVVIEDTNVYSPTDWATFRSTFGLSGYTHGSFTQVQPAPPSGTNNCSNPGVNGDSGEAIIDAEWASASAPDATIVLASCSDTYVSFGGLLALQNLLNSDSPPPIVSISYGECEAFNGAAANAMYNSTYEQAVTEGTTIFVSSGDESAASCSADAGAARYGIGVSGFTSSPYDVSVGGTDFADTYESCGAGAPKFPNCDKKYWNLTNTATYGSAKSYIPEIPWNDSCAGVLYSLFETGSPITYGSTGFCNNGGYRSTASGSGGPSGCATGTPKALGVVGNTCAGWAKPSYQAGAFGNPSDGVRDIPDVSMFASNGWWGHYYVFCDSQGGGCSGAPTGWDGAGGTSFSSPITAGILALIEQKTGSRQGNANVEFYALGAKQNGASGNANCNSNLGKTVSSTCYYNDVTMGDMDVNCQTANDCYLPSGAHGVLSTSDGSYQPAYPAAAGWDFAVGLGTINVRKLVNSWP